MIPKRFLLTTSDEPLTSEEFQEVGLLLVKELSTQMPGEIEIVSKNVEPGSWITVDLMIRQCDEISYSGIVSYSLRKTGPSITSVLLEFRNGKRYGKGKDTILVSDYAEAGWNGFRWARDEFGEWECDFLA
jgi:hypothetical protein